MTIIHHGTDVELFHPRLRNEWRATIRQDWGLNDADFVFLHLGDLRKGGEQSIRALATLPLGKLLVVSRSEDAPFRRLASQLGIENRVVFAGGTRTPERYFAAADAFLCASPYDPFALVVTEAMASGLPVIASRFAGASELITHMTDGVVLQDPFDVAELRGHMECLMADGPLSERIGRAARHRIESRTWDDVASETMRVYERALGNTPTL
jgi:UDP-glucose:(heptosyl)LPS alpha-1,3-glucosyltransferase